MNHDNLHQNWQRIKIAESRAHQSKAFETINQLTIKERCDRKIILLDDTVLTEFVSCSYLGLDQDPRVIEAAANNIFKCGVTFPAARTRILTQSFIVLEALLNEIFCDAFSVIFPNLHTTHLGFLSLLGSGEMPSFPIRPAGTVFILDKTVHASIQINRGLMSQFGKVVIIDFNQSDLVEKEFREAFQSRLTPIAIADSIGSMGGITPILPLFELAEKYQGYVYLDDAHGTSIYGKNGCGFVLKQLNYQFHPRLILTSSLAKAFGAVAGVLILPTAEDANIVKRYCLTYIFSGPPPLTIIDSAIASAKIHLSPEIYELQNQLQKNLVYFDSSMEGIEKDIVNYQTTSPIRGLRIGNEFKAIDAALMLRKQGFALTTAMYPTVAKNRSILRIAFGATHKKEEIHALSEAIRSYFKSNK
jgi:7-keto-8-aminopelargonate synthetase-like enzyme